MNSFASRWLNVANQPRNGWPGPMMTTFVITTRFWFQQDRYCGRVFFKEGLDSWDIGIDSFDALSEAFNNFRKQK